MGVGQNFYFKWGVEMMEDKKWGRYRWMTKNGEGVGMHAPPLTL